jgi:hypothetical protein
LEFHYDVGSIAFELIRAGASMWCALALDGSGHDPHQIRRGIDVHGLGEEHSMALEWRQRRLESRNFVRG